MRMRIAGVTRVIGSALLAVPGTACIIGLTLFAAPATAPAEQKMLLAVPASATDRDAILITICLRHDQSKTLDEINEHLQETGYYAKFPPPGTEVVSWYVMMGVGQVVTLRVPPDRLRDVNRVIEETAWGGGFRTEFYPTYDYRNIAEQERKRMP